ncbi:MAG: carboxylating nicotinate-nucleotide diphosphorylase [Betaproteobacteria bacterium]|jgi:nicotinate-nucleotide pyrophosphorylase (carboxylating)|nr:carboxylating nicotinate-nucleotide diphosphorylase [Betaproteobacteria bacterium]
MYDIFQVDRLIDLWLSEDIGYCDLTAQLMIDEDAKATFHMNARESMVIAGIGIAQRIFQRYDPTLSVTALVKDGVRVDKGTRLLTVSGSARSIVTAERPTLNILQRMCGIATETARYRAEIEGTSACLIDTRKTTPGLRMLEKHAVVCGGGVNHRLGLDNGVMLKDNHIAVAGSITNAVKRARQKLPILTKIEVECDRLEQVREAADAGADVIMLDNMPVAQMPEAVRIVAGRAKIEASGGIRIDTIRAIAMTGVDYISTSKITQSAPAVDIGLDE